MTTYLQALEWMCRDIFNMLDSMIKRSWCSFCASGTAYMIVCDKWGNMDCGNCYWDGHVFLHNRQTEALTQVMCNSHDKVYTLKKYGVCFYEKPLWRHWPLAMYGIKSGDILEYDN